MPAPPAATTPISDNQHPGRGRVGSEHRSQHDEDGTGRDHAPGAVLVGECARDRLRDTPHELSAGECQADRGDTEAGCGVDRPDEERHRLAHAEDHREHETCRNNDTKLSCASYDEHHIIGEKKSLTRLADKLTRRFANRLRELGIIDRARKHQSAHERRHHAH